MLEAIVDNRGRTCPVGSEGIPLIATNCICNDALYPKYETSRYVSQVTYESWFRGHPRAGDILFVCKGSPGRTNWVPDPVDFCIAQDMVSIRADVTKVYPKYLFAVLRSFDVQNQIENLHVGTMIPHFKKGDFDKLLIPVVDKVKQKIIGDFYFSVSEKIELNRQINQTLEAMAQAIFKSWFVDFDPVKAKIAVIEEGEDPLRAAMCAISGKTDAELEGMSGEDYEQLAATAALFPDGMEDSELGEIPRGWEMKTVSDIAQFAVGRVAVSELTAENYISTENMLENRGGVRDAASIPSAATVPNFKKRQILISNIRPYFKKIWLACFDGGRSNDVLAFEAIDNNSAEFLYNLLYQDEFFDFMMRTSKGS